jgi:hypothetical protein
MKLIVLSVTCALVGLVLMPEQFHIIFCSKIAGMNWWTIIVDTDSVIIRDVNISWIHLTTSVEYCNITGHGAQCYPYGMISHSKITLECAKAVSKTFWGNGMLMSSYSLRWAGHCPLFSTLWRLFFWQSADRAQRRLVKNSFIVELSDGHRKLRHLFLFNDVIACAKYKVRDIMFRKQEC